MIDVKRRQSPDVNGQSGTPFTPIKTPCIDRKVFTGGSLYLWMEPRMTSIFHVCGLLRNSWHVDLSVLHASKDPSTEIYKIMQKYWNLPIEKRCCPVRILERWIHDATRNLLAQLEQIDLLACSTCHNGKTQTNTQSRVWKLEKPKKCTARALDNFMMVTWPESTHYESFLEPGGK